jgi:hypothetical protein
MELHYSVLLSMLTGIIGNHWQVLHPSAGLVTILKRHVPVGISGHWWLLQHGADLCLLDLRIVAEELAHQQVRAC